MELAAVEALWNMLLGLLYQRARGVCGADGEVLHQGIAHRQTMEYLLSDDD